MEYLMTYGWAFLIAAIVIGALFASGVFNPPTPQQCLIQAGLQCLNYYMATNGMLTLSIIQFMSTPINVTAIGCNQNETIVHMQSYSPNIEMQVDANYTFNAPCYSSTGAQFSGSPGEAFRGYLIINYTDIETGFPQVAYGQISVDVK